MDRCCARPFYPHRQRRMARDSRRGAARALRAQHIPRALLRPRRIHETRPHARRPRPPVPAARPRVRIRRAGRPRGHRGPPQPPPAESLLRPLADDPVARPPPQHPRDRSRRARRRPPHRRRPVDLRHRTDRVLPSASIEAACYRRDRLSSDDLLHAERLGGRVSDQIDAAVAFVAQFMQPPRQKRRRTAEPSRGTTSTLSTRPSSTPSPTATTPSPARRFACSCSPTAWSSTAPASRRTPSRWRTCPTARSPATSSS